MSNSGSDTKRQKRLVLILVFLCFLLCVLIGCGTNVQNITRIQDQSKLAEIAVQDNDMNARRTAVARLNDQSLLERIAVEDKDAEVRITALSKITNQEWLAKMAVETKDERVRIVTMWNLTDMVLIARLATGENNEKVRRAAVNKLTDQGLLAKIALADKDAEVRSVAVMKLTDQGLLAKIAVEDKDEKVRRTVVEMLTDRELLAKIALADKDTEVRSVAVKKLADQGLLAKIAVEGENGTVRAAAVWNLSDKTLLARIMKEDQNEFVCEAAYYRLNDLSQFSLLAAVRSYSDGVTDKIKTLLRTKITPEELSASLFAAVISGKWEICNELISAGADINSLDGYNNTPLMAAIKTQNREVALQLIKLKADISLKNKKNINALYLSAYDTQIIEALLRNNARIVDIKVDNENPDQAALSYQSLAYFIEGEIKQGLLPATLKSEVIIAYELAAKYFDSSADYYGRKANSDVLKTVAGIGLIIAVPVATAGNVILIPGSSIVHSAKTNREMESIAKDLSLKCQKKVDCYKKMPPEQDSCYNK